MKENTQLLTLCVYRMACDLSTRNTVWVHEFVTEDGRARRLTGVAAHMVTRAQSVQSVFAK